MMRVKQRCFDVSAIATNTPMLGKLKPNPKPQHAMPKIPECVGVSRGGAIAVSSLARKPHLVCAVHPTGPNTNTWIDFRESLDAEREELWEPEGASYYGDKLILQP
ncbi:hypothetical protein [Microcoleus sp. POL10_C6]|uniref:hypothetical protein n=1 Tax=Microcoleus sp. POL10_C6 TaxID=2818852 RepID=UPI002FD3E2FC